MSAFRSALQLWAQVAGLLATGWLVWARIAPYYGRPNFPDRILEAVGIAICALGWSAVVGLTLLFLIRRLNRLEVFPETIRPSAVVWFAPATLLLLQFSAIGSAAGLALVVTAARLCTPTQPIDAPVERETAIGLLSPHFAPVLFVSAGLQSAVVGLLMGHPLPAAGLFVMSTAMLTALAIGLGAWVEERPRNLPRTVLGLTLTLLLALMVGGAMGGFGWGLGWSLGRGAGSESDASKITALSPPPKETALGGSKSRNKSRETLPPAGMNLPGDFPGVILWPEVKPTTLLIAPALAAGGPAAPAAQPLTIPFGCEYWMFRKPYQRPPQNSYFRRGTPAGMFFSTTDHFPLQMEARQKLERAISVRCCSHLKIAILNVDRYPRSVWLETFLIDGGLAHSAPLNLGTALVTSSPGVNAGRPSPVSETLDFPFPSAPRIEQFDEIKVVFHRAADRIDKSARVSIERFVLVPLG